MRYTDLFVHTSSLMGRMIKPEGGPCLRKKGLKGDEKTKEEIQKKSDVWLTDRPEVTKKAKRIDFLQNKNDEKGGGESVVTSWRGEGHQWKVPVTWGEFAGNLPSFCLNSHAKRKSWKKRNVTKQPSVFK